MWPIVVADACFVPRWLMTSTQMSGSLPQCGSRLSGRGVMTSGNKQTEPTPDGARDICVKTGHGKQGTGLYRG